MSFFIRVYNNIEYIRSLTLPKRADARKVAYAPNLKWVNYVNYKKKIFIMKWRF